MLKRSKSQTIKTVSYRLIGCNYPLKKSEQQVQLTMNFDHMTFGHMTVLNSPLLSADEVKTSNFKTMFKLS